MGLTSVCSNREKAGCAGKPGPLVDIKIIDEFDHEVEVGRWGRFWFEVLWSSWILGRGRFNQTYLPDEWHHTGDAAARMKRVTSGLQGGRRKRN